LHNRHYFSQIHSLERLTHELHTADLDEGYLGHG
jgi:hypothetical protein